MRRLLLVDIDTDGDYCGDGCIVGNQEGGMEQHCLGGACEYDWQARRFRRNRFCREKAREARNGDDNA
jgi:hypothetical protein